MSPVGKEKVYVGKDLLKSQVSSSDWSSKNWDILQNFQEPFSYGRVLQGVSYDWACQLHVRVQLLRRYWTRGPVMTSSCRKAMTSHWCVTRPESLSRRSRGVVRLRAPVISGQRSTVSCQIWPPVSYSSVNESTSLITVSILRATNDFHVYSHYCCHERLLH